MMTVVGLVVAAPGSVASATTTATFTRNCPTSHVMSLAYNNPIRVSPSVTSTVLQVSQPGYVKECLLDYYTLGDRYTACGVSYANGWIKIWVPGYGWGYGYMTCWEDY